MTKFVKAVAFCFGLFVVAAIAFPFAAYQLDQPRQHELQTKILNGNFARVQLQNGQVRLVPAANRHLMRTIGGDFNSFGKPMLLSVGSQFKASDRHWGATYTIESIESDGVVIHFKASGGSSATSVRGSTGTIKLVWK